ncbi:MAG: DUF4262 domain-containing protein [Myxococcales bacterium]|nr:DUF4262 domain-containing protein [Myxococcales bacterium]
MFAQSALFHLHEIRDTTVRVCSHVAKDSSPVLHVIRGADGSWVFLCGRDHLRDHHEGTPIPLKELISRDPTLNAVAALAPHDFAERQDADEPWVQGDQLALEIPTCIEEHGWFVALVGNEPNTVPRYFAYTIGLPTTQAHPELIMLGQTGEVMPQVINTLGKRISEGLTMEPGTNLNGLLAGLRCECKPVHPTWFREYLGYGLWYHGSDDFEILQVFWADSEGRFPWDPQCDPDVARSQPDLSLPKQ